MMEQTVGVRSQIGFWEITSIVLIGVIGFLLWNGEVEWAIKLSIVPLIIICTW